MSDGLNRVFLFGTIGSDPDLKMTSGGSAILKFRVATNESYKRGDQWEERTDWHSVVIWGRRAEGLARILKKGDRTTIEGALRTSSWDDREGNKRYRTEVHATFVGLSGSGGKREEYNESPRQERSSSEPNDDDIPF